jgi:hypothetical protein
MCNPAASRIKRQQRSGQSALSFRRPAVPDLLQNNAQQTAAIRAISVTSLRSIRLPSHYVVLMITEKASR